MCALKPLVLLLPFKCLFFVSSLVFFLSSMQKVVTSVLLKKNNLLIAIRQYISAIHSTAN